MLLAVLVIAGTVYYDNTFSLEESKRARRKRKRPCWLLSR